MKIRGTAQHIGEKYLQLARDAQTSGDPVAAESYLQHAEHYFRIIAAAQQAQYQAQTGYVRQPGDIDADDGDDDDDGIPDRFALPSERMPQSQPFVSPVPIAAERPVSQDRPEGQERPYRQDRYNGDPRPERNPAERYGQDRGPYEPRSGQDRNGYDRNQRNDRNRTRFGQEPRDGNREPRDTRDMQYREQPRIPAVQQPIQPPAPETDSGGDLPAFITAPVRVPPPSFEPPAMPVDAAPQAVTAPPIAPEPDATAEPFAVRPRRRRRTRLGSGIEGERTPDPSAETTSEE